ncbi:SGNH/GDSL hydrolase family protein [Micromonospora sp. CPCC 205561]|uniref:SGNH/GDSL hydrolase family protein n=1 Tax=Micromonospora sp. CPCC 205561 TaxID=3122407 RepID=UPI002FF00A32
MESEEPNWSTEGFSNHTVRQVVRVSTGGAAARVRLSNLFGATPLSIVGVTVGRSAGGAAVRSGSLRHLTFRHARSVTVPVGGEVASDPVPLWTAPLDSLTVTLYVASPTGPATFHLGATATTYRASGDHRRDVRPDAFTESTQSWYYLAGVDVVGTWRGSVVAFGDSIVEGGGAVDDNDRFPDELAEAFLTRGRPRGVLNAGIGGNRLLDDSLCAGDRGVSRLRRDALDEPGVSTVLVLLGINDIGLRESEYSCWAPNPELSTTRLIAGYRSLIRQGRARGITMVGATLLPFKGAGYFTPSGEVMRDEVNTWIRTSGEFDAVVDLDRVLAAPGDPDQLDPRYDSGDHLHPNAAGGRAMARAVARVLR